MPWSERLNPCSHSPSLSASQEGRKEGRDLELAGMDLGFHKMQLAALLVQTVLRTVSVIRRRG
eukprot:759186-Hanusia_phi.AAC.3